MTDFEEIFSDVVDTPKEGIEQHNKRKFLIEVIESGKAYKLPGKTPWTAARINKASDSVIEKLYSDYNSKEVQNKAENTGKALSKHIVNLYSSGISRVLKIDDMYQLRRDIDNDPVIKDSMADIGFLLVGTFGKFLAPLLIAAHTANHTEGFVKPELQTPATDAEEE